MSDPLASGEDRRHLPYNPMVKMKMTSQSQGPNNDFLFHQGDAKRLGQIQFNDYHLAFEGWDVLNVRLFLE